MGTFIFPTSFDNYGATWYRVDQKGSIDLFWKNKEKKLFIFGWVETGVEYNQNRYYYKKSFSYYHAIFLPLRDRVNIP